MPRLSTFSSGAAMSFILHDLEHFAYGFGKSCGVILASEIGDKTFFIAAVSVAASAAMQSAAIQSSGVASAAHAAVTSCHVRAGPLTKLGAMHATWQVMAMRNPRLTVFAGAIGALAAMTVLSAALGWAAPNLVRLENWGGVR